MSQRIYFEVLSNNRIGNEQFKLPKYSMRGYGERNIASVCDSIQRTSGFDILNCSKIGETTLNNEVITGHYELLLGRFCWEGELDVEGYVKVSVPYIGGRR